MDLRIEFEKILKKYGSDILFVRNDVRRRCNCVKETSMAPSNDCGICLGTGYVNSVEKIKVRTKATSSSDTLPRSETFTQIGDIGISMIQVYFEYNVRPKDHDLIILCGWDNGKPIVDEYTDIYEISHAEPIRGKDGRIEYFMAVIVSDPVDKEIKLHNIQQNMQTDSYYIAMR